jgi:hypothetical protein
LSADNNNLSDLLRDFKSFTATKILKTIGSIKESRKDWMLKRFEFAANGTKTNVKYQFWTHENHAVELFSYKFFSKSWLIFMKIPVLLRFCLNRCVCKAFA